MECKISKIGFIGGGNMARAIGEGLIKKGIWDPKNMWVSARTEKTLEYWKKLGTSTSLRNYEIVENCDVVFIAVKPQMFDNIVMDIAQGLSFKEYTYKVFVSLMVGITLDTLTSKMMGHHNINVTIVRTMPNTPLMVGSGITVYCVNSKCPEWVSPWVEKIFSHLGFIEKVPESQMNALSALTGSGPAFVYQIIEGLSDGAVMAGVPRAMATKFAAQVLVGAASMVLETKKHPGELKDEVCSPGGTTIRGVHAMEESGVRAALMNAIKATVSRADELANEQK